MFRPASGVRLVLAVILTLFSLLPATPANAQQAVLVTSQTSGETPENQKQFVQKLVASKIAPELHAVVALSGDFRGFTKTQLEGVQPANAGAGRNPYRAIIVAAAPAVVAAQAASAEFFRIDAVIQGAAFPAAAVAGPLRFQLSYLPGQAIPEADLKEAGFTISTLDGKPLVTELGKQGGVMTVQPTNGVMDKARVEAALKLKGLKYLAPVYPAEVPMPPAQPAPAATGPVAIPVPVALTTVPTADREPNDLYYTNGSLWGMKNIRGPKAWGKLTDASSIIVAVIDTGVDYDHVELKENMWINTAELNGQPGIDDDGNGFIDDVHGIGVGPRFGSGSDPDGHGTHCAGTIGGHGNNARGVVGVCWRTKIMGIRFLGSGVPAATCVRYAVKNGASVISMSWTQFGFFDQSLFDAIEDAKDNNVIVAIAAANDANDNDRAPNYPSSYDNENIIAVGAIDQNETRASFSNFGRTRVDVFAPGVGIWSSIPNNFLTQMSGTSMACPHVAGACTLVYAAKGRSVGWKVVRDFILQKARKVPALQNLCVTGATLDIGSLPDEPGGPILPHDGGTAGALLAYQTFAPTDNVTPDFSGVLRSIRITLTQPTVVQVGTSFDFQPVGAETAFSVSVANASQTWPGATRNTSSSAGKWTAFAMHGVKKLDAGTHTIQILTTARSEVKFGSGTITVTGFPVTASGGGGGEAVPASTTGGR